MSRNTTIALVLAFAALLVYVLLVQVPRDQQAAQATPTAGAATTYVWDVTSDQITAVRVTDHAADRSVALERDANGTWALTEPVAQPADQAAAAEAAGRFAALFVNTTITTATDLAQFGVLSPAYTLDVGTAGGQQLQAAVGDQTATGSGYYVLRQGGSEVLVVSNFYVDEVVRLLDEPPLPPTPTPEATAGAGEAPADLPGATATP